MISRLFIILLALAAPFHGFKILRPCVALNSKRTLRVQSLLDSSGANSNFQAATILQKTDENSHFPSSKIVEKILSTKNVVRLAVPLTLMFFTAFGLQQSAHASGLIESIQERASSSGFLQAFLLIFVSEIGDKTFFIAALLAAKYNKFISFTGSIGALAVMTVISTVIGQIFHVIPSSLTQGVPYDDYIAGL